jgi:glycosyltransferase involved in cell wall biosynthesis
MPQRVTVVVRTKDRPYFLRRALADIAAQSYDDAQVIVVNDGGSVDAVTAVVAESTISDRVRVLVTEGGLGRCAAANTGLRAAASPYVVLHDDDDLWHPDFLARSVAALDAAPDAAGVMVATEIVVEEPSGDGWAEVSRVPFWAGMTEITLTALLEVNRAVPISFLYRRSLHDEVGFYDESLDTVEDWDFYLRVAAAHRIVFLPGEALAYWTHRPAAAGPEANSMFELEHQHRRDDLGVRDTALRSWVQENGLGVPLYLAAMETRIKKEIVADVVGRLVPQLTAEFEHVLNRRLDEQRERIVAEVAATHPFWARVRRVRARLRRS